MSDKTHLQRYHPSILVWTQEEELYLHCIQNSCEELSNLYLAEFRKLRNIQAKIKIPVIIIGSFTGITSFGTETFPKFAQKWVSVGVGIITIGIAILNTIESYFKIGENANSAINTSNALQQLREDINKELSLPEPDRQAPGLTFLRDSYTRYQQILNQAPILNEGTVYYINALSAPRLNFLIRRTETKFKPKGTTHQPSPRESTDTTLSESLSNTIVSKRPTPMMSLELVKSPFALEIENHLNKVAPVTTQAFLPIQEEAKQPPSENVPLSTAHPPSTGDIRSYALSDMDSGGEDEKVDLKNHKKP